MSNDSLGQRDARFLDPRHLSSSNTSPCGNQPAHISLTVNIDNDTFDTTGPDDQQKRRPGTTIPDAASPCLLDNNHYISAESRDRALQGSTRDGCCEHGCHLLGSWVTKMLAHADAVRKRAALSERVHEGAQDAARLLLRIPVEAGQHPLFDRLHRDGCRGQLGTPASGQLGGQGSAHRRVGSPGH